jgi:leucyl aminopeptidase
MNVDAIKVQLTDAKYPLVLIGVTEEVAKGHGDLKLSGALKKITENVIALGDFKATRGEYALLYSQGKIAAERVMLIGLGKKMEVTAEKLRQILGEASRKVRDLGVDELGVSLTHIRCGKLGEAEVSEVATEAFIMGSFNDSYHKTKDLDKYKVIKTLHLILGKAPNEAIKGIEQGRVIAEAVNLCKKLAWGAPNHITPTRLAEEAKKLGELGVKTKIFDREQAGKIGLHSFLAVAKGTSEQPKFIVMEYGDPNNLTVGLVGKAITFDSGGISLKPGEGMHLMKADMTGGAVVIAALKAAAQLKLPLHIVAIVPATDNMPDGSAYHPGDVVDTYSGLTVEVISTDAEGRMVLNDALSYLAKNYKPVAMFDFATLTGAMEVALGEHAMGYFANDDSVAERIERASEDSGERVWRMPLWDVYDEQLKSDVADWKHTGGRPGGAITAARFLSKFVEDTPWAHFDIAGLDESSSDKGYNPKGSRGPAVRLIIDMLRYWSNRT